MPNYLTPKLEFSPDPLSDTTPTYTDVTSYLKDASWSSGIARDLDAPQAGGAVFVLRNENRDWEPEYSGGRFAGNIVPMRRFRWSITADGSSRSQGTYYATSYQVVYPDPGSTESDVIVTCVDGTGLLALQTLPALDPPSASSLSDVIQFDNPFAYYPLNESTQSKTAQAVTGPQGAYRGSVDFGGPSPVVGSNDSAPVFHQDAFVRAKLDDEQIWNTSGQVTIECVVKRGTSGLLRQFVAGPFDTTAASPSFFINSTGTNTTFSLFNVGAALTAISASLLDTATHHIAMTYDGSKLVAYIDGVNVGTADGAGNIISPDANEFIYIGSNGHGAPTIGDDIISDAAFYDYALSASRIAAHANAALLRGYTQTTAGSRIASLATNSLWSTAGIPTGTVTVTPRMQMGQKIFDEIVTTVQTETPIGLFFFNDAGNPDYYAWDDTTTIQATLGEFEVQYDDVVLIYDDQIFNQATASRDGGLAQTANDTTSQGNYGTRTASDLTGLIVSYDHDADMVAQAIVDHFANPQYRIESVTLNAATQLRRTQILLREIGDTIRIKRRGQGGTANPDIVTRIIGKAKHLDVNGHLTCQWTLARGFPAADAHWRLGQDQYTELGTNTILA